MLGSVDQEYLYDILSALNRHDGPSLIAVADRMAERSLSFEIALQELAVLLHRIALVQNVPQAVGRRGPDRALLETIAASFSPRKSSSSTRSCCTGARISGSPRRLRRLHHDAHADAGVRAGDRIGTSSSRACAGTARRAGRPAARAALKSVPRRPLDRRKPIRIAPQFAPSRPRRRARRTRGTFRAAADLKKKELTATGTPS
jgi:hypothetical protein